MAHEQASAQAPASPYRLAEPEAPKPPKVSAVKSPVVLGLIGAILVLVVLFIALNKPPRTVSKYEVEKIKLETSFEAEKNRRLRLERGEPAKEFNADAPADLSQRLDQLQQQLTQANEEIISLKLRLRDVESRR